MNADRQLRIVLADDSVLLREGISRLLTEAGLDVVGQVGTAEDLLDLVRDRHPDVAVVDIKMPPEYSTEGLRAAEAIRAEHHNEVAVLVLSQYVDTAYSLRLVSEGEGGVGYVLKDRVADVDEFVDSIRRVARGGLVLDPAVVARLVDKPRLRGPLDDLSERERDVLALMAEGRSNAAIAQRLFVTPKTVEAHTASMFSKLGLLPAEDDHRRVLAVLEYLRARE
jgi:DNA-binding NarL/FixJ family response regulator